MEELDYTLPSPTDTPYRTPSSSRSRQSTHGEAMSPSSSPPPLPPSEAGRKRRSHDSTHSNPALDENISPLDPRRFTPTLHASLVSEILSLRRELEGKTKDIERLEDRVHNTQSENDRLNQDLSSSNKESRNLKRQLQQLEGGTLSALGDITTERDEARNDASDLRRRLEQSQRRAKSQEEAAERTQSLWDRERDKWAREKRALETKVNVVEGRLKVVLSEIANYQQNTSHQHHQVDHVRQHRGSFGDSPSKRSTSALSHRRHSNASNASDHFGGRLSALGHNPAYSNNLADELALDEEDENIDDVDALPEELERPTSSMSTKAHRILGIVTATDDAIVVEEKEKKRPASRLSQLIDLDDHQGLIQSPPPSPKRISLTTSPIIQTEIVPIDAVPTIQDYPKPQMAPVEPPTPVSPIDAVGSDAALWNRHESKVQSIMISASCQTTELLPSPPLTPDSPQPAFEAAEIQPTTKTEMKSASTQTDKVEDSGLAVRPLHMIADYRQHPIPTISIIPPASRPATPDNAVVLPPRTKNAYCQVDFEPTLGYNSIGIQTDEVDLERKVPDLPPLTTTNLGQFRTASYTRAVPPNSSRRRFYQGMPTPPMDEPPKVLANSAKLIQTLENGPTRRDTYSKTAPARTSSLLAGFEDDEESRFGRLTETDFDDDDLFSRPTAKFTLKFGKMVSQDSPLEDVDELAAADVGEAVALEHLRQSEDSMASDFRSNLSGRTSPRRRSSQHAFKQLRRVPSPKRYNIRKAALISSGTAAHSAQSSVRSSSDMIRGSLDGNPPPFPVPIRFSSARIGKSRSEGGRSSPASSRTSPTRKEKHRSRKPILRKARSGPAISPGPGVEGRRQRSQSPPLDSRISIVPDMPTFRMPAEKASTVNYQYQPTSEASAPRPSVATGPHRKTSHVKTGSDAVSLHSSSVVDAIAQTMVGEWMFKYVRRRKSFGVTESKGMDYDPTKTADEISAHVTSTGVRHKRWVWLAPYERSVMWSSKQPTSNSALLGKSGRKLTIQSVLDVKDDNPMPKGSITGAHFNRSILILTPQRALKFTALTQDRHYVWLTALSFLSHSPLSMGDLAALPPPPSVDGARTSSQHSSTNSLRRRQIRDSIRIAKGSNRPGPRYFTTDGSLPVQVQDLADREQQRVIEEQGFYDPATDAALPPTVPRFSAHTRKRSNTAPRPPPSSYKSFTTKDSVPVMPPSSNYPQSIATSASGTGRYTPSLGVRSFGSRTSSRRNSEASAMGRPSAQIFHNGQDQWVPNVSVNGGISSTGTRTGTLASNTGSASGTMRMDAFIEARTPSPILPQLPQQSPAPSHQHHGPAPLQRSGFAAGLRRMGRKAKEPITTYWADEGRGSSPMRTGMEQMLLADGPVANGIYGSTRGMMLNNHAMEVEVGGSGGMDPFRGF